MEVNLFLEAIENGELDKIQELFPSINDTTVLVFIRLLYPFFSSYPIFIKYEVRSVNQEL